MPVPGQVWPLRPVAPMRPIHKPKVVPREPIRSIPFGMGRAVFRAKPGKKPAGLGNYKAQGGFVQQPGFGPQPGFAK